MGNQQSKGEPCRIFRDGCLKEETELCQLLDDAQYLLQHSYHCLSSEFRDLRLLLEHAQRSLKPSFFLTPPPVTSLRLLQNGKECVSNLACTRNHAPVRSQLSANDDRRLVLPPVVRNPGTSKDLSLLLSDEHYLLLIFDQLVDYGLQECRLVCKQWYELCKQFPIRLENANPGILGTLKRGFPNATSMSVNATNVETGTFISQLATFQNLRRLELKLLVLWNNQRHMPSLQGLQQLKELAITPSYSSAYLIRDNTDSMKSMYSSLRHLTNLTVLKIDSQEKPIYRDVEPFVELKAIRELQVPITFFVDEDGRRLFPALTNLTKLCVARGISQESSFSNESLPSANTTVYNRCLEAIRSYTFTLESLSIFLSTKTTGVIYAPLLSLEKLKILDVEFRSFDSFMHFIKTAVRMSFLESFSIRQVDGSVLYSFSQRALVLSEFILKHPESFLVRSSSENVVAAPFWVLNLMLDVLSPIGNFSKSWARLRFLKRVYELCQQVKSGDSFVDLSCLEEISITAPDGGLTTFQASQSLHGLKQLTSLKLEGVTIDKSFFHAVTQLTNLTSLRIQNCKKTSAAHSSLSKLNLLTSLEELELRFTRACRIDKFLLPGRLSRLSKLTIQGPPKNVQLVREKVAKNHIMEIHHRPSLWSKRP